MEGLPFVPCGAPPASRGFARGSARRPWCSACPGTWNPGSPSIVVLPRLIEDLQHPLDRRRLRQETSEVLEASHGPEDNRIASVFNDQSTPLFNPMSLAELNRDRGLAPPGNLDDLSRTLHAIDKRLLSNKYSYEVRNPTLLVNPIRTTLLADCLSGARSVGPS